MNAVQALHEVVPLAGLLLVSAEGARVAEWRPRETEELRRFDFSEPTEEWRDLHGPALSHPRSAGEGANAFRSGEQRDLFERRLAEHRARFVRDAAREAATLSTGRGWELVLVLGDPRLTHPAAETLAAAGLHVVELDRRLDWVTPHELALRVAADVDEARTALQLDLLRQVHDEALTGGRGALGRDDCETTLTAGRVATLLVDPALGGAAELAEGARARGARVVPATERACQALAPLGGVVALLHW